MTLAEKIDALTADPKGLLGTAMLAVTSTGETLYSHASGRTALSPDAASPVSLDSLFRIASCTKLITSIATLKLVEQGKLHLDDPGVVQKWLPELAACEVFDCLPGDVGNGEGLRFKKREEGRRITLRMLMTHSSGVGYDMLDPRLGAWRASKGEPPLALVGPVVKAFAKDVPLLFQPGEGWAYGGGLDCVGLVIERVAGMRLGVWMRENVFRVLGCEGGIGFASDLEEVMKEEGKEKGRGSVQTVLRTPDGTLAEWVAPTQKADMGGGGLLASPRAYAAILADLISPTPKVLSKDSINLLFSPQFADDSQALAGLRASSAILAPVLASLGTTELAPEALNHGLGGLLVEQDVYDLGLGKGTMAWFGSFNLLWFANRERGVVGFFACSVFPPGDAVAGEVMGGFVREVWGRVGGKAMLNA